MPALINPESGELGFADDPTPYVQQGWRIATPQEADAKAKELDFGTAGQTAQALGERVVRGGTLGAVRGFGSPEDIQARADVSQRQHPVLSFAADVAPQVGLAALGAATGGAAAVGLGAAEGGLAAAGGALAGESVATGLVGAGQQAFERGQYLGEDPGRDAENALIWGGINFGLGAASRALFGAGAAGKAAQTFETEAAPDAARASLEDLQKAAETEAAQKVPTAAEGMHWEQTAPAESVDEYLARMKGQAPAEGVATAPEGEVGAAPEAPAPAAPQEPAAELSPEAARAARIAELSKGFNEATGLAPEAEAVAAEPAIPRGAEAAQAAVAERAAVDDGMERAVANASRGDAKDILDQALSSKVPDQEVNSFGRQRALYQNRQAILDVSVKEMQQDLTDVVAQVGDIVKKGKAEQIAANVGDNIASQKVIADSAAQWGAELSGALKGEARTYAATVGERGLRYAAPGTKDLVANLMDHATAISEAKTGSELFGALTDFHEMLGKTGDALSKGAENAINSRPILELMPRVSDLANKVRSALEDANVWGKAADMTRAYNAVINDQLLPSMQVFQRSVLERTSTDAAGMFQTEGWESKIKSLLTGDNLGAQRHVDAVLGAMDQLGHIRAQYGDAAGGRSISEGVAKIQRTMKLAGEVQNASRTVQAAGALARKIPLGGRLAKEWITGDLATQFRQLTQATDSAIGKGVDDWLASSTSRSANPGLLGKLGSFGVKSVTGTAEDSAILQIARRQGVTTGLARFMGPDKTPLAAFTRARDALSDDQHFFASMGGDYQSLQHNAPETYLMLSGQAAQARQFLLSKTPPNVSVSMMNPQGYPPSKDSIAEWATLWNAIREPMRVIANLRSASPAELEAVQTVYPRLYEQTQQRVLEKLGQAQAAGRNLDDSLLMKLGLLFPLDGVGSPAFSSKSVQLAASYQAPQQGGGAPAPGATKAPGGVTAGPVQGIAQSGATFGTGF